MPKKWSAQELADRSTTVAQAKNRIRVLWTMIEERQRKIKSSEITLMKHQKEIRLLLERFQIVEADIGEYNVGY